MSNTLTVLGQGTLGNFRVILGTLVAEDGSGGDAVDTGLNNVTLALANSNTNAQRITSVAGTGDIMFTSAASGVSAQVVILGN